MSKKPSPKSDQLRALTEARFTSAKWPSDPIPELRDAVAAIPVKKPPKKPKVTEAET